MSPEYIASRNRKSTRLPNYDYSAAGHYFVTVHAVPDVPVLSRVDESGTYVNELGVLVQQAWNGLAKRFPLCETDVFSVQPNHVHGITVINITDAPVPGESCDAVRKTLGEIMRAFKSLSAIAINKKLGHSGTPVWQRGFHDRVIRDENELLLARQYVSLNELKTLQQRSNAPSAVALLVVVKADDWPSASPGAASSAPTGTCDSYNHELRALGRVVRPVLLD